MTILRFVGWAIGIVVVTAAGASVWLIMSKPPSPIPPVVTAPVATSTPPRVVAEASYLCDGNRAIKAVFMEIPTQAVFANIARAYKQEYNKDLITDLKSELEFWEYAPMIKIINTKPIR